MKYTYTNGHVYCNRQRITRRPVTKEQSVELIEEIKAGIGGLDSNVKLGRLTRLRLQEESKPKPKAKPRKKPKPKPKPKSKSKPKLEEPQA